MAGGGAAEVEFSWWRINVAKCEERKVMSDE
jgi:hypothetical protein